MRFDKQAAIQEIDVALSLYEDVEGQYQVSGTRGDYIEAPEHKEAEIITRLQTTIDRLAPVSNYAEAALKTLPRNHGFESKKIRILAGVLKSLRDDYEADRLQT